MKRKANGERGATLVEFALILPVFMALVLGTFTGGLAYNRKMQMTHAAREGARYGATLPEGTTCGSSAWAECVRSVTVDRSSGEATSADVCVALVTGSPATPVALHTVNTPTGGGGVCFADSSGDAGKRVQVRITRTADLEVLFFSTTLTLTSKATARFEAGS